MSRCKEVSFTTGREPTLPPLRYPRHLRRVTDSNQEDRQNYKPIKHKLAKSILQTLVLVAVKLKFIALTMHFNMPDH